jgi:GT2 family glycosyltransferase
LEKVGVAILNWNGEKLLPQFLPSVLEHSPEGSVFVIDNGSSDNSIDILRSDFPKAKLIVLEKNHGFSEGYNLGLADIDTEIVVLLNSDVEVTANWLTPLIQSFDENSQIGAIQPKILSYQNKKSFEYAGASGGFIDSYGYPLCRGRLFNHLEEDHAQYDDQVDIFWASGACLAIRKNLYFQAGGLDPLFFAHMEEIDLCWRLHRKSQRIICETRSVVYHLGGGSLAAGDPKKTYLNFRNNLILLAKNLKAFDFYKILILRLILDGIAGIKFLLAGSTKEFFAVIRAHFDFYKLLRKIRLATGESPKPKLKYLPGVYNGLLPWQFYVKNKKTFQALTASNPK